MDYVKILHMSDLHFGCKLNGLSNDKAQIRRSEIRQSFLNCVSLHCDADIVLIAGDIFDRPEYDVESVNFLVSVFEKYKDIRFFIVCGNHDPYNSPVYTQLMGVLPENAYVFPPFADCVSIDDKKVKIYGISFENEHETQSLIKNIKCNPDDGYINILVMHGDTENETSIYNPINKSDIISSNFDYIALGHIHKFSGINRVGGVTYAYSGTHESHGADEDGSLGCIYGNIGKDYCDLEFDCTCMRTYKKITVDISNAKTIEDVKNLIDSSVNPNDLFTIELTGALNEGVILNDFVLSAGVNAFYTEITKNVHVPYNLEQLSYEATIRGYFAKNVIKALSGETNPDNIQIIKRAADCVINAFENGGKIE